MDRLEELALLVAIVEGGSLAAGGRKTRRSPAGVTRILGDLERRLGVRLIERTTRRLEVTAAGRSLVEHARGLLSGYEDAISEATGENAVPRGTLRLSAPLVFGRRHLAPVVADFLEAHREVSAELHLSNRMVDLIDERIDAAVRIGPLGESRLVAKPLGEVRRVLVASPKYLRRRGTPRSLDSLSKHDLVDQLRGDDILAWQFTAPHGKVVPFAAKARFLVSEAETAIDAACAGRGIVRVLSYQVRELLASRKLVRLLRAYEPPALPVSLVYRDPRFLATRVRAFVEYAAPRLKEALASAG